MLNLAGSRGETFIIHMWKSDLGRLFFKTDFDAARLRFNESIWDDIFKQLYWPWCVCVD